MDHHNSLAADQIKPENEREAILEQLDACSRKLNDANERANRLEQELGFLRKQHQNTMHELRVASNRLDQIYRSDMYRFSLKYYRIRDKIFAPDSIQHRLVKSIVRVLKRCRKADSTSFVSSGYKTQLDCLHSYGKYSRMDIITTKHTLYVARLMKRCLDRIGIKCEIHIGELEAYEKIPYIIICPQFVKSFPEVYFVMQMEQTVSSRWFTPQYFLSLQNSCGVLDYALDNVEYFHHAEYKDITSRVYYLPVDYYPDYWKDEQDEEKTYDVLFYGDVKNERRKRILEKLSEHFRVKVCSEVYQEELYQEMSRAKVLVNIHYYEGALLETTRLYEALSVNSCVIVSEDSESNGEIDRLKEAVDFVAIDDVDAMIERIDYWLKHDQERKEKVRENQRMLEQRSSAFDFYFYRFLLAHDRIDFDTFYELAGNYVQINTNRICLSLAESTERRRSFEADNHYGFQCFPGLKHEKGWVGCGLSYKFIFKKASEAQVGELMICEDDVIFPPDFSDRLNTALDYLHTRTHWSVFSGVMADLGKVHVRSCDTMNGQRFVEIDHMMSMVFNVYHHSMFRHMCAWNEKNCEVEKNTIDRYLQQKDMHIFVSIPFLVGHKEELNSTIWGFSNVQYADMISDTEKKLIELADEYEKSCQAKRL